MKKIITTLMLMASCAVFAQTQNAPQSEIVSNLLQRGEAGASSWTLAEDGSLKSLFIVGVAPLNKALPSAYAKKMAATQARLDAENTLSKTLNTMFEAKQSSSGEMVVSIKGEAAGDSQGVGSTESSMTSQVTEEMKSVTKSAQAGLMQLVVDPNRDGSYVAVYVWNRNITKQLKDVSKTSAEVAQQSLSDYKDTKSIADSIDSGADMPAASPAPEASVEAPKKASKTGAFKAVEGNSNQKIVLPAGL
ncbi:hypothetical protein [Intestinicryptomonas porci]|uniref:Uncharacterized protein n=1 Tax=Intestinicryptomonas porci TaxID=2926320 RepID=A0ABU4WEA6_9BACT|nr:hypothetical protein [Opitutales bacterium CLA-KB-P66]